MGTKERILETALRLFNEQGIDVITIRHIAKEMGISHSNIQYYFKNADEIITTIYEQHLAELANEAVIESLPELIGSVRDILTHIYEYRFIYIYFVAIVRRIPALKILYSNRYKIRREQLLKTFALFREQGIFRADLPDNVWDSLVKQIYTIGDFWISANELTTNYKGPATIKAYVGLIADMLYPYLTAKGRKTL